MLSIDFFYLNAIIELAKMFLVNKKALDKILGFSVKQSEYAKQLRNCYHYIP